MGKLDISKSVLSLPWNQYEKWFKRHFPDRNAEDYRKKPAKKVEKES